MAVSITTIPKRYQPGLAKIICLSPRQVATIAKALESAPLGTDLTELASLIVRRVPRLARRDVDSILTALFSLSHLVTDEEAPLSESLSGLTAAMQATGNEELALSKQKAIEFEKRLGRLLTIRVVVVASKARRLAVDYANIFYDATILTDMRPVFDKPEEAPVGCAISHTLKIDYYEGGEHREFYAVMDAQDLERMRSVLQRADAKAASLRSLIQRTNLVDLS